MSINSDNVPPSSLCSPTKRPAAEEETPVKRPADTIMSCPSSPVVINNNNDDSDDDIEIIEQEWCDVEKNLLERIMAIKKDIGIVKSKAGSVSANIIQIINDTKAVCESTPQQPSLPDYEDDSNTE